METTTRTRTLHRGKIPHYASTGFDPPLYGHIGEYYCGISEDMADAYARTHKALEAVLGSDLMDAVIRGECASCGAIHSYGAVYEVRSTGEVFGVGHTCARNSFSFESAMAHKRARVLSARAATKRRLAEQLAGALAGASFLEERPDLAADLALCDQHHILDSLRGRLFTWGRMSDKQVAFAAKLADEVRNPPAKPEKLDPVPVPVTDERVTIEGTIISVKFRDSQFGGSWKMLVEVPSGEGAYRLWGTLPASLDDAWEAAGAPGDFENFYRSKAVRFVARLDVSNDDKAFGFFKRPTKATLVAQDES